MLLPTCETSDGKAKMKNELGLRCRVCGVVDDRPGEDILEPGSYDLEWVHDACRVEDQTGAAS
jgi:hypothetical protein